VKLIETHRLRLRPFDPDRDAAFLLEVLNEPDYIANVADREVRTLDAAANFIREKFLPGHERYGVGYCVVELRTSGVSVGTCGLIKRETMDDFDIGYSTLERFSGNGYAFEAASALMHYGRTELGIKRIIGLTSLTNARSAHLLEKLGLRYERNVQVPGFADESRLFAIKLESSKAKVEK
jgi:RimJ/RimL family protein N-acetyltransferase